MKICTKCREAKPDDDFYLYAWVKKDGTRSRNSTCKECCRKRIRDWKAIHPGWEKEYIARLRMKAFEALGGPKCPCGVTDVRVLDIDHIEGGGTAHRREVGNKYKMLRAVLDDPSKYRVLCKNCNWIAYVESG